MTELIYREEVFAIVGAAMEVHSVLGPGFLEAVYQEALEIECTTRQIPFVSQYDLRIDYKGRFLKKAYVADYFAYNDIIIEIKAMDQLTSRELAQLLNYLNATGAKVGVLINFGSVGRLEWRRMARTRF
jgi:GxxExxY protein